MALEEERYKFVTGQLGYHNDKILETFSQFTVLISAVVGGIFWLRARPEWPQIWSDVRDLAYAIVVLIGFQAIMRIVLNLLTWWGYRHAEVALTSGAAPTPRFPGSCLQEVLFIGTILVATVGALILLAHLH